MSYIRGDHYIWADDSNVHFWARDGYDNWDNSVWNQGGDERNSESHPSGVALSFEVADEFVVMRIAQLIEARQLTKVATRTLEKWKGNGGCRALIEWVDRLKEIESEPGS